MFGGGALGGILQIVREKEPWKAKAPVEHFRTRRCGRSGLMFRGRFAQHLRFLRIMVQDSLNLAQVEDIVAEYGWLAEHKIG